MIVKEYYTVAEVAELFRVVPATVYRWMRTDKLNAVQVGASWRIPQAEIQRVKEGSS